MLHKKYVQKIYACIDTVVDLYIETTVLAEEDDAGLPPQHPIDQDVQFMPVQNLQQTPNPHQNNLNIIPSDSRNI